jgi:hypothetical protein
MAIEDFIKAQNKLIFEQKMQEAANDRGYLNRLAETETDFALVDDEEMSARTGNVPHHFRVIYSGVFSRVRSGMCSKCRS